MELDNFGALVCGAIFFPGGFALCTFCLGLLELSDERVYVVSSRLMSATQAVLCCTVGCIIVSSCGEDVLKDRHWLTEPYICFVTAYLVYDAISMLYVFLRLHPEHRDKSCTQILSDFISEDPWNLTYLLHHLALPIFFLPVVLYFRRGLGDYFVGCFMMIEAFIPFASLRDILIQFGLQRTSLYLVNGLLLLVVYLQCRILIFPFLFWRYGHQMDIELKDVPKNIPWICNLGSGVLFLLFSYWGLKIAKEAGVEIVKWINTGGKVADEYVEGKYIRAKNEFVPSKESKEIREQKKKD